MPGDGRTTPNKRAPRIKQFCSAVRHPLGPAANLADGMAVPRGAAEVVGNAADSADETMAQHFETAEVLQITIGEVLGVSRLYALTGLNLFQLGQADVLRPSVISHRVGTGEVLVRLSSSESATCSPGGRLGGFGHFPVFYRLFSRDD